MSETTDRRRFSFLFWLLQCCYYCCLIVPSYAQNLQVKEVTPALELGEGPHWDPYTQSVYFVDLHQGKINRYHPETDKYFYAVIEGYQDVTFVIPVDGRPDTFVVGLGPSIGFVKWDGFSTETDVPQHVQVIDVMMGNRLNDAKADASGRLWVGSMGSEIENQPGRYYRRRGSLFSVELNGTVIKRLSNISISNGLAWSSDNKRFFFIDTYAYSVQAFDFDIVSGNISNGSVIFDLKAQNVVGDPDGMTIDTDGNLWVACFNSNHILKIDSGTGELLATVELPAYQITSASFGGPNLDDLYVTTAGYQLNETQKAERPLSGAMFRVTNTGATGYASVPVKIPVGP